VIKVQVPSLNERRSDIMPLAKHFLMEFSNKFGKAFTKISANTENALITHNWTGHVRELKNIIEKGVLVGKGPILEVRRKKKGYPIWHGGRRPAGFYQRSSGYHPRIWGTYGKHPDVLRYGSERISPGVYPHVWYRSL
jgi:DNA-binding NtrC family response regulator